MADTSGKDDQDSGSKDKESHGSVFYWKSQIDAAKKVGKSFFEASDDAWREYVSSHAYEPTLRSARKTPDTRFPIYWASTHTIQPAIYSRTPIPVAQPTLDTLEDRVSELGCDGYEKLAKYLMRRFPFDRVCEYMRDEFIHSGKTAPKVHYESKILEETTQKRIFPKLSDPQQMPDGTVIPPQLVGWIDDLGAPVEFDGEPLEDDKGYYVEEVKETLEDENISLLELPYRDVLHTPYARTEDEITWKAYGSLETKKDVEERFGKKAAKDLRYSAQTVEDPYNKKAKEQLVTPDKFVRIWEIWDKEEKVVRFLPENGSKFLVPLNAERAGKGAIKDPYGLPGFFPSPPFLIGTYGQDNMFPTPDFVQLRPFINQLHALSDRFRRLVRSNKVRGVYDAAIKELADLGGSTPMDGDYIGINNFQGQIIGKGGLDQVIQHFPTEKIVEAVQLMGTVIQQYKDMFNEIWGIPDIIRGVTDPNEPHKTQVEKGRSFSLRFLCLQRNFQRLVRDSMEWLTDLALLKFSDERLSQIMGFTLRPDDDKKLFPQILALLRDFENRPIRIDIETDSTIAFNEQADVEQRMELLEKVTQGLLSTQQASAGDQKIMLLGLNMLMYAVRGLHNGKQITEQMQELVDQLSQPPTPQPPPPDPAQIAAEASVNVAQIKAQSDQAIAQMKSQTDAEVANIKGTYDAQIEQLKGRIALIELEAQGKIDAQAMQSDALLKTLQARIDAANSDRDHVLKVQESQFQNQLDLVQKKFDIQMEAIRSSTELEKARLESKWQLAEATTQAIKTEAETKKATSSEGGGGSKEPIQIHLNMPSPHKKHVVAARTPEGHTVYDIEDMP